MNDEKQKKKKKWKVVAGILIVLIVFLLIFGKKILYKVAAHYIYNNVNRVEQPKKELEDESKEQKKDDNEEQESITNNIDIGDIGSGEYSVRDEDYITNFLIMGIEDIDGASNTDTMIIASIDTRDDTIKLTSLMRDSYVEIPGYYGNKLNWVYSHGGIDLFIETIELNYKIAIDGYASVNLEDFESVIDVLGGVDIELSEEEAKYLNTENYVSDYSNHNLKPGMNHMNGNQVVGYCRVRKVKTIEGEDSDYGRIARQKRVLTALFEQYMSTNILDLYDMTGKCLSFVTTDLSESMIENVIQKVVDNKIMTLDNFRLPVDGAYYDTKEEGPLTYSLVYDWDENIVQLYQFIYGDTYSEAVEKYNEVLKARGEETIEPTSEEDAE